MDCNLKKIDGFGCEERRAGKVRGKGKGRTTGVIMLQMFRHIFDYTTAARIKQLIDSDVNKTKISRPIDHRT